jgi:bifunctional non-homologous end joining protein LigD
MSVTRTEKGASKRAARKALPDDVLNLIKQGTKAPMPQHLKPMLCEKKEQPFDGEDWIYELKLDGYRIISNVNKGKVTLYSREAQNYTARYPIVVDSLSSLKYAAVIDGEMVALNKEGKPDFAEIQNYNGNAPLIYYAFDILWLNGYDIKSLPLIDRKKILSELLAKNDVVKYVDHVKERGKNFFNSSKSRD